MKRISLSRAKRLYASDVEVGCWLVYERDFGISPPRPIAYGATEEEARENARRSAQVARIPPERYDGEAYLIVPDQQ
jgi:hypothetical protein